MTAYYDLRIVCRTLQNREDLHADAVTKALMDVMEAFKNHVTDNQESKALALKVRVTWYRVAQVYERLWRRTFNINQGQESIS